MLPEGMMFHFLVSLGSWQPRHLQTFVSRVHRTELKSDLKPRCLMYPWRTATSTGLLATQVTSPIHTRPSPLGGSAITTWCPSFMPCVDVFVSCRTTSLGKSSSSCAVANDNAGRKIAGTITAIANMAHVVTMPIFLIM